MGFSRHTIPADGHTCLFYAIANEGSAEGLKSLPVAVYDSETGRYVWTDDKEITQRELLELTFSGLPESKLTEGDPAAKDETGKKYSSSILPMAVKQEVVITKETENLTLPLRRSLGKMELYFAKAASVKVTCISGAEYICTTSRRKDICFPKMLRRWKVVR